MALWSILVCKQTSAWRIYLQLPPFSCFSASHIFLVANKHSDSLPHSTAEKRAIACNFSVVLILLHSYLKGGMYRHWCTKESWFEMFTSHKRRYDVSSALIRIKNCVFTRLAQVGGNPQNQVLGAKTLFLGISEDWGLRTEDWGLRIEDSGLRTAFSPPMVCLIFTLWDHKNPRNSS